MMPQGTTVNMAAMMRSERLSPENIGFSLVVDAVEVVRAP
jgi:hypothetical protein